MSHEPEKQEWLDALTSLMQFNSREAAEEIMGALNAHAGSLGLSASASINTPYLNSIAFSDEAAMPDDGELAHRLFAYHLWNVICMVMLGDQHAPELGGHIGTYASTGPLFEVGLNHFFRGRSASSLGDLVYFQGHAIEGIYSRAYFEGRITLDQLHHFRRECEGKGLSSYPHPWLMPDFWEVPSVCLGLGPLSAIYQAQFQRYLNARDLVDTTDRHVWMICGDGELNEPESLGALNIAARDCLDNLTFVISCNLQRLDGLVHGNGQVIQEYEGVFRGAGWHVIKIVWGGAWDTLFQKDTTGILASTLGGLLDGEVQQLNALSGAEQRDYLFGRHPDLLALVADMTDEQIKHDLIAGGHDFQKVYAAFAAAKAHQGQPTVVLARTVKAYGVGKSGESKNIAHNTKKVALEDRKSFAKRFDLPLTDQQIEALEYVKPADDSEEIQYLHARRSALGGYLPARRADVAALDTPALDAFSPMFEATDKPMSSTMAFNRILGLLLKDANIKDRVVPMTSDEARTFGMEGLFRQIGIYSHAGQQYTPEDKSQLMYYRESKSGQFLQHGITEAGCMASWTAAATSYATSQFPMIPFFIYYSMFGYQRTGDFVWAAGDARARGFIIGATAGRTTLSGEGLQHEDGHNVLMFSFVPNCVSYDPTYAYEMAVIIQDGLRRMYHDQEDVFYYITAMNENYMHPAMPEGVEEGIRKGLYLFEGATLPGDKQVQLLGAGAILNEVRQAKTLLEEQFGVGAAVWSATSMNELNKDARAVKRHNRLHPNQKKVSYVTSCLQDQPGPVIAATDYIKIYAEQIRSEIAAPYYVLGTDGYGRSDTRPALRAFFEVDANSVAYTALVALYEQGQFTLEALQAAKQQLQIDDNKIEPVYV